MDNWEKMTIGEILKKTREEKGLSLDEIASQTNISKRFLVAIEEDRFDKLPGSIHVTGFIRLYGGFLGLDENLLMQKVNRQIRFEHQAPLEEITEVTQNIHKSQRKYNPLFFLSVGIIMLLVLIIVYLATKKENLQVALEREEEVFEFNKITSISKGHKLAVPVDSGIMTFRIVEITTDLVNIAPEIEKNKGFIPIIVKKKEYLRWDFNNDGYFDLEINLHDIIEDEVSKEKKALISVSKIKEIRLKDQEQYVTGIKAEGITQIEKTKEEQQAMNNNIKLSAEIKNIVAYPIYLWVIKNVKTNKEEFVRLNPGASFQFPILEGGSLLVEAVEASELFGIEMVLNNQPFRFEKAKGLPGYVSFEIVNENGVQKLNWKAIY